MIKISPPSTVFILDDDLAISKVVRWSLESIKLTVQTYLDPLLFLKDFNPKLKGCLLLDVSMPSMNGLEVQEKLKALGNTMPIILMSGQSDIAIAVCAMKAGAMDFITKPFNDQHLIELVQKALQLNQQTTSVTKLDSTELVARYARLTEREKEVLQQVAAGKMNKVIAADMAISIKTVELHRGNVMQKMQAKSLADLVRYCMQLNLA